MFMGGGCFHAMSVLMASASDPAPTGNSEAWASHQCCEAAMAEASIKASWLDVTLEK